MKNIYASVLLVFSLLSTTKPVFLAYASDLVPVNDLCENALFNRCSGCNIFGTTLNATLDRVECPDYGFADFGIWYKVVGHGGVMQADLCGSYYEDHSIFVSSGTCVNQTCISTFRGSNCESDTLWYAEVDVVYNILVHRYDTAEYKMDFILSLIEKPTGYNAIYPPNALCKNAQPITIDNPFTTLSGPGWFRIVGNGRVVGESACNGPPYLSFFSGPCDQQVPVAKKGVDCSDSWLLADGVEYNLRLDVEVDPGNFQDTNLFYLDVLPTNDICEDAKSIAVGSQVVVNVLYSTVDGPFSCEDAGSGNLSRPGVWYKVFGNGNTFKSNSCDISVFSGTCGNLACVTTSNGCATRDCFIRTGVCSTGVEWKTEDGVVYYILIRTEFDFVFFLSDLTPTLAPVSEPPTKVPVAKSPPPTKAPVAKPVHNPSRVCIKQCVLVNLATNKETILKNGVKNSYTPKAAKGHSVRCDNNLPVSRISFEYNDSMKKEFVAPYWMNGSSRGGRRVNDVKYLASCGTKKITVRAKSRGGKECYRQTFTLEGKCGA